MKSNAKSDQNDLHLRCKRGSSNWEVLESPARYFVPLRTHRGTHCTVHLQGTCLNYSGKELSMEGLSELIDRYRMDVLDHLDGSFVIAVSDSRDGAWCATDHSGTVPLYYSATEEGLTVSTRAENAAARSAADLDLAGLISTLNTGYPWGNLTLLHQWKFLRPGQVMSTGGTGKIVIKDYFAAEKDDSVAGFSKPEELLEEINAGLIALASRYKKFLIPLSGGVDSRLITMQCHKLGIPFEAITFVANVPDGDDFDIASRLVKIYGVKHHRWEWKPTADTLENFFQLCISTAGTNDAYTTYPDGMKEFAAIASEFDCVLRGDHSFGFGAHCESLFQSAHDLGINYKENLNWLLRDEYQNRLNVEAVFAEQEEVDLNLKGSAVNEWRHRSRRLTRNPRAHLPIGQVQSEHAMIAYPLLTRNIVKRMARCATWQKNNKQIAHDALAVGSPPDIKRIPHSTRHTWLTGEPLLNLPPEILRQMIEFVQKPGILNDLVDEALVAGKFAPCLDSAGKPTKPRLRKSAKQIIKQLLPTRVLHRYKDRVAIPSTPAHMIFKRLFAVKTFVEAIQKG